MAAQPGYHAGLSLSSDFRRHKPLRLAWEIRWTLTPETRFLVPLAPSGHRRGSWIG